MPVFNSKPFDSNNIADDIVKSLKKKKEKFDEKRIRLLIKKLFENDYGK